MRTATTFALTAIVILSSVGRTNQNVSGSAAINDVSFAALISARPRGPSPPAEAGIRTDAWAAHRYRASGRWDLTTVVVRSGGPRIDVPFGPRDTGDAVHVYPKLFDIIVLTVDHAHGKDVHLWPSPFSSLVKGNTPARV